MWNEFEPAVQQFLSAVFTGVLSLAAAFILALAKKGFDWLTVKVNATKNEEARKLIQEATDNLRLIVNTTVTALNQTLGDDIRASLESGDGKHTREDLLNLKDAAVDTILTQLNESYKQILQKTYPMLEDYVGDLVETAVRQSKS